MHNAAFAALGLNWRYLAFEVDSKNLRAAIDGAKAMGFAGLNLTVPHKVLAMDMVDELDESAKIWGAVNTIRFEVQSPKPKVQSLAEVRAVGFNTDADGLMASLREDLKMELADTRVLLIGAGGAGRTAALKLASENVAELFLVNRTVSKAKEIAGEIKRRSPSVKVSFGYPKSETDLLVNATSLGLMPEDCLPWDEEQFALTQTRAVYDMIYQPAETKLLAAARRAGCKTANGIGMLVHQGAKAFQIWTGCSAPVAVMRRAVESVIQTPKSNG
jgi:shikimate dehydrogenase